MAVTRMLTRVKEGLEEVFAERSAPDDRIDFDASLEFVQHHGDPDDEESSCTSMPIVNIWVALFAPEIGKGAKSTCQIMVPVYLLETSEEVKGVGNDIWNSLQSHRALSGIEADLGTDHPDGE